MTKKFTGISSVDYVHTTGIIMRDSRRPKLIGYCVEPPKEVFEKLFPKFYVTKYRGYKLFSSEDFDEDTPMKGLAISAVSPVFGIKGKLQELIASKELDSIKREKKVSVKERKKIRTYLNSYLNKKEEGNIIDNIELRTNPKSERAQEILQKRKDIKEIVELLKRK